MGILDSAGKSIASQGNVISGMFNRPVEKPSIVWDDFPDGLVLTEVVNGILDANSVFKLNGNFRPKVPFTWGGTQRKVVDYYAGNPEPVVHIIGPQEKDVTIQGRFYDKKMGKSFRGAALEYAEKLDSLRYKGSLLQIQLGEWTRYGFIDDTDFKMKNRDDIDYEIKFTIISFTLPSSSPVIGESKILPFAINDQLLASVEAFQETYTTIPDAVPGGLADELNDLVNEFASVLSGVTSFVNSIMTEIEQVQTSINRAIGLVRVGQKSSLEFRRRLGSLRIGDRTALASVPDKYATASFIGATVTESHAMSSILSELRAKLENIAKTVPIARYKVQGEDSLQKIAIKFYGSSDDWKLIYDHNNLTTTALTSGTVLEIPRKT